MDFVDIGHRPITLGERRDLGDRRDIAVHRVKALEHHKLRPIPGGAQKLLQMAEVIVAEDLLFGAGALHALDHRIVVRRVRENEAIGQKIGDCRNSGEIGDPAGGEHQRRLLAVQIGKLVLKLDDGVAGAGNIAGAPGAGAGLGRRFDHGGDHLGVLAHAEIIVRAPDRDVVHAALGSVPEGERKGLHIAFDMSKDPIAALIVKMSNSRLEIAPIIHSLTLQGFDAPILPRLDKKRARSLELFLHSRSFSLWREADRRG